MGGAGRGAWPPAGIILCSVKTLGRGTRCGPTLLWEAPRGGGEIDGLDDTPGEDVRGVDPRQRAVRVERRGVGRHAVRA